MESFIQITFATILFSISLAKEGTVNYYWKDYTGIVPHDAVPGGYDVNHTVTYIGQGFLKDYGILPGTIYPGDKNMLVTVDGVKRADTDIKILCSHQWANLKWVNTTTYDYKWDMAGKHPVRGGVEHTYGETYLLTIGRTEYNGALVIGKIVPIRKPIEYLMYHASNGRELSSHSYEVLVSEPNSSKEASTLIKEYVDSWTRIG